MRRQQDFDGQNALDSALAEFSRRIDAGETVDRAQFLKEHSDVADALAELLDTADYVQQVPHDQSTGPEDYAQASDAADVTDAGEKTLNYIPGRREDRLTLPGDSRNMAIRQFGEYELLEELGRGGMGVVYKAVQTNMNRLVAVKMILSGRLASKHDVDRFYAEAKAAGKLSHPNIVNIYHAGEFEGHHFFSMEFVEGTNLAKLDRDGLLPSDRVARYLRTIAEAVHYAHENGVLHRDLKPSNILIDSEDRPQITDFGLAKDIENQDELTSTGTAVGTPSYMSPEQAQAKRDAIGRGSDVYSLGAILYKLLAGRPPFREGSVVDTLMRVIHDDPTPPSVLNPDCNRDLEAICLKCLRKNPRGRYASAQELADDLGRYINGEYVRARRVTAYLRGWKWLRDIPLVSAIAGRKVPRPTVWHVRVQWAAILLVLVSIAASIAWPWIIGTARLRVIDFSAGAKQGSYYRIAADLGEALSEQTSRNVEIHESPGAVESHDRLARGVVDLAILQENTIASAVVQVLAPLYYEVTLVLVRSDSDIESIADLEGRSVALGEPRSGMRLSSEMILDHYGVSPRQLQNIDSDFETLLTGDGLEGAIVTAKLDDRRLATILESGLFRLLPIRHAEKIPGFRAFTVYAEDVPRQTLLPPDGTPTAATMAILAVRRDAPDWFVTECLQTLYVHTDITSKYDDVFTLREAAAWQDMNLHDAAQRFFQRVLETGNR